MRARIQKWGNSLAVRIPKPFATEARVDDGTVVDLSLAQGKIVVAPVPAEPASLKRLIADVTKENLHTGTDFGARRGREAW